MALNTVLNKGQTRRGDFPGETSARYRYPQSPKIWSEAQHHPQLPDLRLQTENNNQLFRVTTIFQITTGPPPALPGGTGRR